MESVPLTLDEQGKRIVTQSNSLTEARYNLTVGEQRLVLTVLSLISPTDKEFQHYKIKIWDLKRLLHLNHNDVHRQAKDAIKRLANRVLDIPQSDGGWLVTHWFSSARYAPSEEAVYIKIDEDLKPYLLELKEQFTKFNLFTIAQFQSAYTIRIYMLLKQYEKLGFREFDLQKFRLTLGIDDNKYKLFKDLNKNVISRAKKDFEKKENGFFVSDITFDLETIRTGRKITRLRFNIRKQTYQQHLDLAPPDDAGDEDLRDVIGVLKDYGISEKMAQNWLDKYGQKYIEEKIYLVREQKPKNAGGYLRKAIEENYTSSSTMNRQQEQSEQAEEKRKLKSLFNKKWLELASNKYYEEKTEEIQNILPKEILDKLKEKIAIAHKDIKPDFIRDKTIGSEYKKALKDEYIKSPDKETLEEIKDSIPAPRSSDFSDDVSVKIKIEKYIKTFSVIENV